MPKQKKVVNKKKVLKQVELPPNTFLNPFTIDRNLPTIKVKMSSIDGMDEQNDTEIITSGLTTREALDAYFEVKNEMFENETIEKIEDDDDEEEEKGYL